MSGSTSSPQEVFFSVRNATVWQGQTVALSDLNLDFHLGESVAILGPNGSGKSTLLKLLTGELRPATGEGAGCQLFGERFWDLDTLRQRIGVVMPEEVNRFHPNEIAFDVVLSSLQGAYGLTNQMQFTLADKERTTEVIAKVGMTEQETKDFGQLSSGEKRRFLIARALVHHPDVVVLDEPTTALDFPSSLTLSQTLRKLTHEGQTLVWVTHHPSEIPPEVTRIILLKEGEIFGDGSPEETLTSPLLSELYGTPLEVRHRNGWHHVTPQESAQ